MFSRINKISKRSIVSHDYHDCSGVPDNDEAIARALELNFNGSSTTSTSAFSGSSTGGIPLAVNCAKPRTPSAVSISTASTVSQSSSESTACSSAGISLMDSSWAQSAFPEKLHHMLMLNKDPDIISFARHGRCFILHRPKVFASEVMPNYFKHTKLTSFQRQLNLYGFKRITYGPDSGAYYHELFLRGRPRLCAWMKRQKNKGLGHKPLPDPENEPDFYAMDDIDNLRSRKTEEKKSAKKKPKMKRINMYNPFLRKDSPKKTKSDGNVPCDGSFSFSFSSQFQAHFKPATYPINQPQQAQTFFSGVGVRIPYAPQMPPQHVYDLPPQQRMSFPVPNQKLPPPSVPDQIYVGPTAMPLAHLHHHHQQQLHQYRAPQHISQNFFPQCAHHYGSPQPQQHQTNVPYNIEMCGVPNLHNTASQVCPQCKSGQLPTSSNLPMPANLPTPANLSIHANLSTLTKMCNNQQPNSTGPSHNFNCVPQVPATNKNISPALVTHAVPEIQRSSPEYVKDHANENRLPENPSDLSFLPNSNEREIEFVNSQLDSVESAVESAVESSFLTCEVLGDEEIVCRLGQGIKNSSVVPESVCPGEKSNISMSYAKSATESLDDDSTNGCVEDDSKIDDLSIGMRSVSLASTVSLYSEGDEQKNKLTGSWRAMLSRLGNKSSDRNLSDRSVHSSESITSHWLWDPTGHVASGVEDDIYFDQMFDE